MLGPGAAGQFFDPPTTHLITNIEDLTDILEGGTKELEDQDKEMGKSAGT